MPILEYVQIQFKRIAKFQTWGNGRDMYGSGTWAEEGVGLSRKSQY